MLIFSIVRSFQFLLGDAILTFINLQERGNYNFVIKLFDGPIIHGCNSSNNIEWFARSLGVEAEQFMQHEF